MDRGVIGEYKNLTLANLRAVIPLVFSTNFASGNGLDLFFVAATCVNGAAGGFTADLMISSFVFWIYMFSNLVDGPQSWVFIALNLFYWSVMCASRLYLSAHSSYKLSK